MVLTKCPYGGSDVSTRGLTCRLSSDLNIFGDGSVEVGC